MIDEPELSLHPIYQRRLAELLADYAKDRQIIYATHSPYFVNFKHISAGAAVARIHKRGGNSIVSQLSQPTIDRCTGLLTDTHNPHVLGLDARETFFLWVPIIRSWALTRGFALHPGTRNRYEIRYTRTQHRPASRHVNDHGRVSGTNTMISRSFRAV